MWKMLVGFALFAALAVFALMKAGGDIDMGGEKHGVETAADHAPAEAASPAASPAASAASGS